MTENTFIQSDEQPYKLPDNWYWATVGNISNLYRGVSYKKNDAHTTKQIDDFLILRGGNIKEGHIDLKSDNVYVNKNLVSETQIIKENDIIIVASTGSKTVIGRAGISDKNYSDVSFGAFLILVRPLSNVNSSYLDYFFQGDIYRNRIKNLAAGININNIKSEHILNTPIPLPPLDEQQRIVDIIEKLFTKLNLTEEKLNPIIGYNDIKNTTIGKIEFMRKSILARAFRGKL